MIQCRRKLSSDLAIGKAGEALTLTQNHILIVEDDPDIAAPLAGFLRDKGFSTVVSESAEAASEILGQGEIDLVLLDVMLPGEDGLALCRRLRASGGPRIIMVTVLSEPTDKVIGLELGANDYVSKPFDLRELLVRIRAVGGGRRPAPPPPPPPRRSGDGVALFRLRLLSVSEVPAFTGRLPHSADRRQDGPAPDLLPASARGVIA
jgi:DNA-binding response OmpR family regulator